MPHNNKYIEYDMEFHRHILKEEYLRDKYGIELAGVLDSSGDINPETLPKRWLNQISSIIHRYIYTFSKNKWVTEYLLATDDKFISCLQEAMGQLAYSVLFQNVNLGLLESGINENGVKVQRDDIRKNVVPVQIEDILREGGLLFRGTFYPFDYSVFEQRGEAY